MARVLIVDDIAANLQILSLHLGDEGYDVLEAQSGPQALATLQAEGNVDLILLDVMMPGMNGLEVLGYLKRQPNTQKIPVILVTANADDDNVAEGLDMGAFDYIIKPYSLIVLLARARAAIREKERLDLLEKWATSDPLTGLYNRRHFFDQAGREFERAKRNGTELAFVMIDIDYFKQVNDEHGHLIGDQALISLSNMLKSHLRKIDFCCRFGGEEFVLCLPDTSAELALEVAERIREETENIKVEGGTKPLVFTISLGVAEFYNDERLEDILRRADTGLYLAKQKGRNQVQRCPIG